MAQRDGEGHLGFHRDPVSGDIKFDLNPPSALPLFSEISREATRLTDLLGWDPLPSEQNSALRHESAVYSQALKATLAHLVLVQQQRNDAYAKLEALQRELDRAEGDLAGWQRRADQWMEAQSELSQEIVSLRKQRNAAHDALREFKEKASRRPVEPGSP